MEAYAHWIHMHSVHESSKYKPDITHPPPGKEPLAFVFEGFLAETDETASKKLIRTTSSLTMLAAT